MISKLASFIFGLLLAVALVHGQPADPAKPEKTVKVYLVHLLVERVYNELGLDISPEGYAAEYVSPLSTKPAQVAVTFGQPTEPLILAQGSPLVLREKPTGDVPGSALTITLAGSAPTYVVLLYGSSLSKSKSVVYPIDIAEGKNVTRFYNPTGEAVALKVGAQTALLEGRSAKDFTGLEKKFDLQIAAQSIGKWRLRYSSTLHREAEGPTVYLLMSGGGKSWMVTPLLLPKPQEPSSPKTLAMK